MIKGAEKKRGLGLFDGHSKISNLKKNFVEND